MKTITLIFAAAALTFAQAPAATPAPSKTVTASPATATSAPVKKHAKRHAGKKVVAPAAVAAAPAAK